jgi:hypothetical protein
LRNDLQKPERWPIIDYFVPSCALIEAVSATKPALVDRERARRDEPGKPENKLFKS